MSDQFGINSVVPDPDTNPYKGMEHEDRPVPGEPGKTVRVYFPKGRPQPVEQEPEAKWQSPSVFYANLVSEWRRQWGVPVLSSQRLSILEKFNRLHAQHPEIYQALVTKARRLVNQGETRLAIAKLVEDYRLQEKVRVSNDFRAHYARLIMEREPDLTGIFEIRELETL